ncbi:MAG: porin family protein [Endomicrobium sp.]|jgi:outer membrane protein assembly factor BamA|nr:porin family protein [Endomicrobium sp.]
MKKLLIAAVMLAAVSVNGFAYSFFVGGELGIESITPNKGDSNTTFSVSPYVGYLLNDKSDISIGFSYSDNGTVDPDAEDKDESSFGVTLAYEYAIASVDKLTFYISPTLTYTSTSVKDGDAYSSYEIAVAPNVQYALSERVGLIATLGFAGISYEAIEDGDSTFTFGANGNDTITSIGFYFNF